MNITKEGKNTEKKSIINNILFYADARQPNIFITLPRLHTPQMSVSFFFSVVRFRLEFVFFSYELGLLKTVTSNPLLFMLDHV